MHLLTSDLVKAPFRGLQNAWSEIVDTFAETPRELWPEDYRKARENMAKVRQIQHTWRAGSRARARLRAENHAC